jgi:putative oxidoreductase
MPERLLPSNGARNAGGTPPESAASTMVWRSSRSNFSVPLLATQIGDSDGFQFATRNDILTLSDGAAVAVTAPNTATSSNYSGLPMQNQSTSLAATGRVLLAVLFLLSGLGKIAAPAMTQGYIASMGLPAPLLGYVVAIVVEVVGGLLLVVGYQTRIVSLILAAFTVVAAVVFHHNFADQNEMIHFLKNIAVAGGLLQVAAFGAGSFSLDARRLRAAR